MITGAIFLASSLIVVTIPFPEINDCSFVSNSAPELPHAVKRRMSASTPKIFFIASPARDAWPVQHR